MTPSKPVDLRELIKLAGRRKDLPTDRSFHLSDAAGSIPPALWPPFHESACDFRCDRKLAEQQRIRKQGGFGVEIRIGDFCFSDPEKIAILLRQRTA